LDSAEKTISDREFCHGSVRAIRKPWERNPARFDVWRTDASLSSRMATLQKEFSEQQTELERAQ